MARVAPAGAFLRAAHGGRDEIAIGMSRRIWKEGRQFAARSPRVASWVARRLADAACRRRSALFWRKAKRNTIPTNGSKGRLMRFQVMRLSAAALAMSVALAGAASAQTQPAKPAAPAAPGAPGAPAAPGQAAPGQPAPPSKLDLVSPEPMWAKLCAKDNSVCAIMRDFATSADQPPVISVNLTEQQQGEEKHRAMHLQVPIGVLLRPGLRVVIDKGEPLDGKFDLCGPNSCFATVDVAPKAFETLKKGQSASVVIRFPAQGEASGHELTFNFPLKDFAPAYDGKPTDPKVLQEQHDALQQQLQKRAEEQRKMLEQQQSGVAAPAAPTPAAPALAPPAK